MVAIFKINIDTKTMFFLNFFPLNSLEILVLYSPNTATGQATKGIKKKEKPII